MAAQRVPAMEAAVRIMRDEGVDSVFGCPGGALLPLYTAMEQVGGVEHLTALHEEGAVHMADGWARTSGKPGVAAVAAGPGAARLITGLYAAQQDAVPLVCVLGRAASADRPASGVPRQAAGRPPDVIRLAGPVTKRAERIEDPARIPGAFREAFRIAREGRPGPVLIDLPADRAAAEILYDAGFLPGFESRAARAAAGPPPPRPVRAAAVGGAAAPWAVREISRIFGTQAAGGAAPPYLVSSSAGPFAAAAAGTPRHRFHGRSGPPGWEVPAAIGVRTALDSRGEREAEVVAVIDGHGFPFMAEELAVAAQYGVPFVVIMLNPEYPGPVHRSGGGYSPDVPVGIHHEQLTNHVRLVEAYGCAGRAVADPEELRSALEWARKEAVSTRRPVLVEARIERGGPAPGGPAPGAGREFTP
ncbi:thiamine pyrophosphate-binding protein [Streptomyces sp. NPDC101393]|uniref:thiamine pyrophosphate-binding protein n=1 Tax=Streptomyces sp. NPDC101393 TaxID=3366141 RepID=UPI003822DB1F